jgi:hypothetical protein
VSSGSCLVAALVVNDMEIWRNSRKVKTAVRRPSLRYRNGQSSGPNRIRVRAPTSGWEDLQTERRRVPPGCRSHALVLDWDERSLCAVVHRNPERLGQGAQGLELPLDAHVPKDQEARGDGPCFSAEVAARPSGSRLIAAATDPVRQDRLSLRHVPACCSPPRRF